MQDPSTERVRLQQPGDTGSCRTARNSRRTPDSTRYGKIPERSPAVSGKKFSGPGAAGQDREEKYGKVPETDDAIIIRRSRENDCPEFRHTNSNPPCDRWSRMIRGHPPYVAICEAALKAEKAGMIAMVFENGQDLPVHFVLCDGPCVSFVRVRRMKYPRFSVKDIEAVCKNDIALLRAIGATEEVFRELWVRGPDRRWHRYLILPDAIEELDGFDDDKNEKPAEGKVPPSPPAFSYPELARLSGPVTFPV